MEEVREGLLYTETHEWIQDLGDGKVRIGVTDHAQHELGDIVFVELPEKGKEIKKGEEMGALESVKTVEPVYTPVSGKVLAVNEALEDRSELINQSPYDEGWMIELELVDASELETLLDSDSYTKLLEGEAGTG
ncbi:MAG: glycine cleavage system protein [Candidatus Methanomethylophilaceae archaeon]|nr:glycine cleavage system protein [Candidatus Methanomethylophilaceae archaeon]MDI3542118.1 glycine cleavage system protein [Candidatus Methanomethylophilaceae archaeon]HIJ00634.1 glycine cleavage system protein GcvH [Candidatus Methanomethylophilaceae archaeon]